MQQNQERLQLLFDQILQEEPIHMESDYCCYCQIPERVITIANVFPCLQVTIACDQCENDLFVICECDQCVIAPSPILQYEFIQQNNKWNPIYESDNSGSSQFQEIRDSDSCSSGYYDSDEQ